MTSLFTAQCFEPLFFHHLPRHHRDIRAINLIVLTRSPPLTLRSAMANCVIYYDATVCNKIQCVAVILAVFLY